MFAVGPLNFEFIYPLKYFGHFMYFIQNVIARLLKSACSSCGKTMWLCLIHILQNCQNLVPGGLPQPVTMGMMYQ